MAYREPDNQNSPVAMDDVRELLRVIQSALIDRIEERSAALTEVDVTKVISELASNADILPNKFKQAIKLQQVQAMGRDPLSRILIEQFSKMLETQGQRTIEQGALPRCVLSGFLAAVRLMLGNPTFETLRARSVATVERRMNQREDLLETGFWEELYLDRESQDISHFVYCTVATYFANYTRRKTWFLRVINDSLDLQFDPRDESENARWRMGETHFVELFARIYIEDMKTLELRSAFIPTLKAHFSDEDQEKVFAMAKCLKEDIKTTLSKSRIITNRVTVNRR